jgi:hypothetical protein
MCLLNFISAYFFPLFADHFELEKGLSRRSARRDRSVGHSDLVRGSWFGTAQHSTVYDRKLLRTWCDRIASRTPCNPAAPQQQTITCLQSAIASACEFGWNNRTKT